MKRIFSYILILSVLFTSTVHGMSYRDMNAAYSWAKEAVEQLTEQEIFEGYPDGRFRPDQNITRAELCKLIYLLFGTGKAISYNDISADQWYYNVISHSGGYFLTTGNFYPDRPATREEVAYAVYTGMKLPTVPADKQISFRDQSDISAEYLDAVKQLTQNGIITGYPDESFLPKSNITRAETAVILHRALKYLETKNNFQTRNYFFIVTRVSSVAVDGEIATKVIGYQDGNLCELILTDDVTILRTEIVSGTTIKPGDLIDYWRASSGKITRVSIGVNLSQIPWHPRIDLLKIGNTDVRRVVYGTVLNRYKKGIELKAVNGSQEMLYNLAENPIVYLWKNNKLEISDINEIMDSRYETGDTVIAYCYDDTLSQFVIIK